MSEYIEFAVRVPKDEADSFIARFGKGNVRILGFLLGEEIVRCRDCAYMHTVRNWLGMDVDECWLHASPETGALGKERTEPDGFCAWGERREQ